jgi:hypothetical protein
MRISRVVTGIAVAVLLVVGAPAAAWAYWSAQASATLGAHPATVPGIQAALETTTVALPDSTGTRVKVPLTLTQPAGFERTVGAGIRYKLAASSPDYQVSFGYSQMLNVVCAEYNAPWAGLPPIADQFWTGSMPTEGEVTTNCLSFSVTGPTTNTEPIQIALTIGFAGLVGNWTSEYTDQTIVLTIPAQAEPEPEPVPTVLCEMDGSIAMITFSGPSQQHQFVDEFGGTVGFGAWPPNLWLGFFMFGNANQSGTFRVYILAPGTQDRVGVFAVTVDRTAQTVACAS